MISQNVRIMIIGLEDRKEFCQVHKDAMFAMIKILHCPVSIAVDDGFVTKPHIRLFSIVRKEFYLIPVYQFWHGALTLNESVKRFE